MPLFDKKSHLIETEIITRSQERKVVFATGRSPVKIVVASPGKQLLDCCPGKTVSILYSCFASVKLLQKDSTPLLHFFELQFSLENVY